jgi:ribonuclease P/MRP protein subunit RPP20
MDGLKISKSFKKLSPVHPQILQNDIYVSSKSVFIALLNRSRKLLLEGSEIHIHALGKCILKALNLALKLKELYNVEFEVKTDTVTLLDQHEDEITDRLNSCIHITVKRM